MVIGEAVVKDWVGSVVDLSLTSRKKFMGIAMAFTWEIWKHVRWLCSVHIDILPLPTLPPILRHSSLSTRQQSPARHASSTRQLESLHPK